MLTGLETQVRMSHLEKSVVDLKRIRKVIFLMVHGVKKKLIYLN